MSNTNKHNIEVGLREFYTEEEILQYLTNIKREYLRLQLINSERDGEEVVHEMHFLDQLKDYFSSNKSKS